MITAESNIPVFKAIIIIKMFPILPSVSLVSYNDFYSLLKT